MRNIRAFVAAAAAVIAISGAANAVTLDFPSDTSSYTTLVLTGGVRPDTGYFFFTTHTVSERFEDTGLDEVTDAQLMLNLTENTLSAALGLALSLNGTTVGSFFLDGATSLGLLNYSFSGFSVAGSGSGGEDFTARLFVFDPVEPGEGRVGFNFLPDALTLTGPGAVEVGVVPTPASLPLLAGGLLGLGLFARSRRRG